VAKEKGMVNATKVLPVYRQHRAFLINEQVFSYLFVRDEFDPKDGEIMLLGHFHVAKYFRGILAKTGYRYSESEPGEEEYQLRLYNAKALDAPWPYSRAFADEIVSGALWDDGKFVPTEEAVGRHSVVKVKTVVTSDGQFGHPEFWATDKAVVRCPDCEQGARILSVNRTPCTRQAVGETGGYCGRGCCWRMHIKCKRCGEKRLDA
jgi:hypothetical protein